MKIKISVNTGEWTYLAIKKTFNWKFIHAVNRNAWLAHFVLFIKSDTSADVCQTDLSHKTGHLFNQATLKSNKSSIHLSVMRCFGV